MNRHMLINPLAALALIMFGAMSRAHAADVLTIGVNGVMSGPAAAWGLTNKYCAEITAEMYNAKGGIDIGGKKYKINIVALDDKNDPDISISNAEKLTRGGIKYIIGPNIDTTAIAVKPIMERAKAMDFPYAFSKKLYAAPANASVLSMVASYQLSPVVYKYLREMKGVRTISFVARNEADAKHQQEEGVSAAERLGLTVLTDKASYEPGTTDFTPIMSKLLHAEPDAIVLSGAAPLDAALMIKAARELGFKGQLSTETAQDARILAQVAGDKANGFLSVGGASTPAIQSDYMMQFVERYKKRVGKWNDEASTKVYALELILAVLQKNPKAMTDVDQFRQEMRGFKMTNPFLKKQTTLRFVGMNDFGRQSQVGVPLIVNAYKNGAFDVVYIGQIDN